MKMQLNTKTKAEMNTRMKWTLVILPIAVKILVTGGSDAALAHPRNRPQVLQQLSWHPTALRLTQSNPTWANLPFQDAKTTLTRPSLRRWYPFGRFYWYPLPAQRHGVVHGSVSHTSW